MRESESKKISFIWKKKKFENTLFSPEVSPGVYLTRSFRRRRPRLPRFIKIPPLLVFGVHVYTSLSPSTFYFLFSFSERMNTRESRLKIRTAYKYKTRLVFLSQPQKFFMNSRERPNEVFEKYCTYTYIYIYVSRKAGAKCGWLDEKPAFFQYEGEDSYLFSVRGMLIKKGFVINYPAVGELTFGWSLKINQGTGCIIC